MTADIASKRTPGPWYWDKVMGGIRVRDFYIVQSDHEFPNADERFIIEAANTYDELLACREALFEMLGMWDTRHSIDPGIVRRRGATVHKALAALDAAREKEGHRG